MKFSPHGVSIWLRILWILVTCQLVFTLNTTKCTNCINMDVGTENWLVRSRSRSDLGNCENSYESVTSKQLEEEGSIVYGDSLNKGPFPCWFDPKLARLGQRFARRNLFQIIYAHFISLVILLASPEISIVLFGTGRSNDPHKSFKRYTSTALQIKLWYDLDILDPLWWRSVRTVRNIHNKIPQDMQPHFEPTQHLLRGPAILTYTSSKEAHEFETLTPKWRSVFGYPPLVPNEKLWNAFRLDLELSFSEEHGSQRGSYSRPRTCDGAGPATGGREFGKCNPKFLFSQFMMALTQWAFVALPIIRPGSLSISISLVEAQGFAHLWAVIGYALGMDEKFIFCKNATEDMGGCRRELEDTLKNYLIPDLLHLDPTQKVMMESLLRTIRELMPALPSPRRLLSHLLVDVFHIPTPHLNRLEDVVGRTLVPVRMAAQNMFRPVLRSGRAQKVLNWGTAGGLQYASVKTFANPGSNWTLVAKRFYYLD